MIGRYIRLLQRSRTEPGLRELSLRELIADSLDLDSVHYFPPYEAVHRHNVDAVLAMANEVENA